MKLSAVRAKIASGPAAGAAALALRTATVARHDARVVAQSWRWLTSSREYTNFTYDLTETNLNQLAWFVSNVTLRPVDEIRVYIAELQNDDELARQISAGVSGNTAGRHADPMPRYGRRLGWYALVRALKPEHVVETGTDKGLGSCVLAAALQRNGRGRLTTFDVNPASGYLVSGVLDRFVDRRIKPSVEGIAELSSAVDMFLHDSLHAADYEALEYRAVAPLLSHRAVVLSDNAHVTPALSAWAESSGRDFLYFAEQPAGHWYPGAGIGAAFSRQPGPAARDSD